MQTTLTLQMKEVEKCKTRAITDLNGPNGSRDIAFSSKEFENDGRRHFVGFKPGPYFI